jgi:serine/threonine protein kinase/WD40 repeat protein
MGGVSAQVGVLLFAEQGRMRGLSSTKARNRFDRRAGILQHFRRAFVPRLIRAASSVMARPQTELIAVHEGKEIARHLLVPGLYVVGRSSSCAIALPLPGISRQHAQLTFREDFTFSLEDLGSTSGTFVDAAPITGSMVVLPGQVIQVGPVQLRLQRSESAPLDNGRYEVGGEIAKGGMGYVLAARQTAAGRTVAMKVMLDGLQASDLHRTRFIEEAQITSQLEHPNIVPVHDVGVDDDGRPFYTMKLIHGITLKRIVQLLMEDAPVNAGRYALPALLTIFQKICDAMAFAHSRSVIHRDLKPGNIMVGRFGEVLVMDWGIAKLVEDKEERTDSAPATGDTSAVRLDRGEDRESFMTLDGTVLGTPRYMAPEQARGEIDALDARTDIFSLGVILYELLVLEIPFAGGRSNELLENVKNGRVMPIGERAGKDRKLLHLPHGEVPESLAAVAMKALAFEPGDRYQTVQEFQAEITAYQNGFATAAESPGLLRQTLLLVRRHREKFAITAVALLIIVAASVVFILRLNMEKNVAMANEQRAVESERAARESAEEARNQAQVARTAEQAAEQARGKAEEARHDAEEALIKKVQAENVAKAAGEAQAQADRAAKTARSGQSAAIAMAEEAAKRATAADQQARAAHAHEMEVRKASVVPVLRDGFTAAAKGDFSVALLCFNAALKLEEEDLPAAELERRRIALFERYSPHLLAEWPVSAGELVAFSPDGRQLLTASKDHPAKIPVGSGGDLVNLVHLSQEAAVAEWSPDGRVLVAGGKELLGIYDGNFLTDRGNKLDKSATCREIHFFPDSTGFLSVILSQQRPDFPALYVRSYDARGRSLVSENLADLGSMTSAGLRNVNLFTAVFQSVKAGSAVARYQVAESVDHAHGTRLFNNATVGAMKGLFEKPGLDSVYVPFAVSPDGDAVAGIGANLPNQAALFDKKDMSIARMKDKGEVSVGTFGSAVRAASFSPDARYLAICTARALHIWNTANWKIGVPNFDRPPCIANLPDALEHLSFSKDSAWLAGMVPAVAGADGQVSDYSRNAFNGRAAEGVWLWNLAGARDSGDDVEAGVAILRHNQNVTNYRIDPKNRLMVTTSMESARLWRLGPVELVRVAGDIGAYNLPEDFRQKEAPLDPDFAAKLKPLGTREPVEFSAVGQRIVYNKDKSLALRIRSGWIQVFAGTMPLSPVIACPGAVNAAFVNSDQTVLIETNTGVVRALDLSPDSRPVADLVAMAEFVSGRMRATDGKISALTKDRWLANQTALQKKYGQEMQLSATAAP